MGASLRFQILIDNEAHLPGLVMEHGLSFWIDTGETTVLFDAGRSDAFLENARRLGVDVASADHLVLSHGHYDHGGGLPFLDGILPVTTPIHAHPNVFQERYSRHPDGMHSIGLPDDSRRFLQARAPVFRPTLGPTEIAPDVWLTGSIPRVSPLEDTGGDFWLDPSCTVADTIEDDMALWVERSEGLWVFLGCAHAGTINTIQHIQSVSGRNDVHAVVGGTHLRNASESRLEETARFLEELAPAILRPCHCSGQRITELLQRGHGL